MLAPVVTKRLDQLHASGLVSEEEIDAQTLLLLGEFTPKVAVEIIDQLTKENLEVRTPARRSPEPRSRARGSRAASRAFVPLMPIRHSARDCSSRPSIRARADLLPSPSSPRHLRASRTRTHTSRSSCAGTSPSRGVRARARARSRVPSRAGPLVGRRHAAHWRPDALSPSSPTRCSACTPPASSLQQIDDRSCSSTSRPCRNTAPPPRLTSSRAPTSPASATSPHTSRPSAAGTGRRGWRARRGLWRAAGALPGGALRDSA